VWGGGNISASVHEDMKCYCISVEHVILFFIIITFLYYYYLKYLRLINGTYVDIVLGIMFLL
jgi:hypothetical protein